MNKRSGSNSQNGTARWDASSTAEANENGPDPLDVLRAMLAISPEDAASAREDAAKATKPCERQEP